MVISNDMAQIGHGHGSEFQLMRFLGHHRELLEQRITKSLREEGSFRWLDFGFSDPSESVSGDQELLGLSFLEKLDLPKEFVKKAIDEYHTYSINRIDTWQNWDAVFTLNDTLYLVEAKARVGEIISMGDHGGESKAEILRFFKEQLMNNPQYGMRVSEEWLGHYYQFANRIATAALLNKNGIKTKVIYIYFTNGFNIHNLSKNGQKVISVDGSNNATKEAFLKAIEKEKKALSLDGFDSLKLLLAEPVFIKADTDKYED